MKNLINAKLKIITIVDCLTTPLVGTKDSSGSSYIRAKRKDTYEISTIVVDRTSYTDASMKAEALNNCFKSVFTQEDTENIPTMTTTDTGNAFPSMPNISFSTTGIQQSQLQEVNYQQTG